MSHGKLRWLIAAAVALTVIAGGAWAYAHWRTSTAIDGRVVTGNVGTLWAEWQCDGIEDTDDLTATAQGFAADTAWSMERVGSPSGDAGRTFEIWRTDRDVAQTVLETPPEGGGQSLVFRLDNAYPSHFEECEWRLRNRGSIPLAAPYVVVRALNPDTTFASTIFANDGALWLDLGDGFPISQINPNQDKAGSLRVHVEQIATPNSLYEFEVAICFTNWNEPSTSADDVCGLYEFDEVANGAVLVSGLQ